MFRSRYALRGIAIAGVATLALTACGGGGDETSGGDTPEGDGTLTVGTILPQTGTLAFLGPPEFAGVDLAVKEINEAGGVLGKDVVVSHKDSGDTSTDIASQSADALISEGADVVIGAASSSVSFNFMAKLNDAQIIQISPANTSPDFTTDPDAEYYYRTAPSDIIQGRVLADTIIEDGYSSVAILALQDSYGTGLADEVEKNIVGAGGEVVLKEVYDPQAAEFSAEVAAAKASGADALVLITFEEFTTLAPQLAEGGMSPEDVPWYMVDGNLSNYGDQLPEGLLDGVKGTKPGVESGEDFQEALLSVDPELNDFTYGPESYDATIIAALAAEAAGSDHPNAIKAELVGVTKEGEKCEDFASCKALLDEGKDIDYDGRSGPIEWTEEGDIAVGSIGVYQYDATNEFSLLGFETGSLD
ncbi:branched-chain amino acid transport system substrate-binding protein [Stackebrandtia albiflava]|uniref:Branched-chain amino acid transport system substrate-binding protein n=1 Tax=Stackebrandtia albiflava TaxID=406432 RepID=A0A562VCU5_9ACTN|nr:ABC transporter substrate-binding protein [Stackebrandtia albiflava]TWJ15699.1 branched-chain amino acid transport system substrate-binding protein [Stackebrandtia albiflava]